MSCAICGEDCKCGTSSPQKPRIELASESQWVDPEAFEPTEQSFELSLEAPLEPPAGRFIPVIEEETPVSPIEPSPTPELTITESIPPVVAALSSEISSPAEASAVTATLEPEDAPPGSESWREEVSARLQSYRSKRKLAEPRYPSLQLPFDSYEPEPRAVETSLALGSLALATPVESGAPEVALAEPAEPTNVIVFPRYEAGPFGSPNSLADPVTERPRIVEVPDLLPPQPALGGITLEPVEAPAQPAEEILAQSSSLQRRLLATGLDLVMVMAATSLFGFIVWKLTALNPEIRQIAATAAVTFGFFWLAYQYLLVVYCGKTIGSQLCHLELCSFDGSTTSRKIRRFRVLSTLLSAGALFLGYFWALVDEDSLCWHDRVTRSYFRLLPR